MILKTFILIFYSLDYFGRKGVGGGGEEGGDLWTPGRGVCCDSWGGVGVDGQGLGDGGKLILGRGDDLAGQVWGRLAS
jgi:hypothetical protein